MGASRTGSYEVTPPARSRAGDALAEPTNPAQDSQIASASGGSHPTSSAAYILILTASGMASHTNYRVEPWGRVLHLINLSEGYHTTARRAEPYSAGFGFVERLPPSCRVLGRCQVEGMPYNSQPARL
jgi:hypothetical protein